MGRLVGLELGAWRNPRFGVCIQDRDRAAGTGRTWLNATSSAPNRRRSSSTLSEEMGVRGASRLAPMEQVN
ncbi:unnamed protein product, partial [Iphiclides podalirius]